MRRQLLPLAALILLAGCDCRSTAGLHQDAYVTGGYGSPFYAEVPYAAEEGAKTRVYIFGTVAGFDKFVNTKQVEDKEHKKVFQGGRTLVVEVLNGSSAKEDPGFSNRLISHYQARHPVAPVAE